MAGPVSHLTLPGNFFSITSPKLLTQPEPQYIYANLAMAALSGDLQGADGGMGHIGREIVGTGASYVDLNKDRLQLAEAITREALVTPVEGTFVGMPGTTVNFNRPKYEDSTYTQASRMIGPNASISTTAMGISSEQAAITLATFAGPYSNTAGAITPFGIDRKSASLGVHSLSKIVGAHLKRDYHKTLDSFINALYNLGTAIYPEGVTTEDGLGAAGSQWMTVDLILKTEATMNTANLPRFPDGKRLLTLHPEVCRQLKQDTQYALLSQYFPEVNAIFRGTYIGTVGGFHIVESTTLTTTTNSSSNTVYYGHAIAPGGVGVAAGMPAQVAYSNDDNYGETAKVIWKADHAFAELDNRFTYVVKVGG